MSGGCSSNSRRLVVSSAGAPVPEPDPALYTGEHWAEKLAAEIADALGIPHAVVELAQDQESRIPGAMVRDLEVTTPGALVHGNELLIELDSSYPMAQQYHTSKHTLDNIFAALSRPAIGLPDGFDVPVTIRAAEDLFVGYLLLDALIGNADRHHENWALIRSLGDQLWHRATITHPAWDGIYRSSSDRSV